MKKGIKPFRWIKVEVATPTASMEIAPGRLKESEEVLAFNEDDGIFIGFVDASGQWFRRLDQFEERKISAPAEWMHIEWPALPTRP